MTEHPGQLCHQRATDGVYSSTRHPARECAATVTTGQADHTAYAEATATVARFLQTLAMDLRP